MALPGLRLRPLDKFFVQVLREAQGSAVPNALAAAIRSYDCDPIVVDGPSEISFADVKLFAATLVALRAGLTSFEEIPTGMVLPIFRFCNCPCKMNTPKCIETASGKLR